MPDTIYAVSGLTKTYTSGEVQVLRGVDPEVKPGFPYCSADQQNRQAA